MIDITFKNVSIFVLVIGALLGGLWWLIAAWAIPVGVHDHWEKCSAFCVAAQGFHTNNSINSFCECKSLSDHSRFLVNTANGEQLVPRNSVGR